MHARKLNAFKIQKCKIPYGSFKFIHHRRIF